MFAVDKRRLQLLTWPELTTYIAKVNAEWERAGRPPEEKCPMWLLGARAVCVAEVERRGQQMRLDLGG